MPSLDRTTILSHRSAIDSLLAEGRIGSALDRLAAFAREAGRSFTTLTRIEALSESYTRLCDYFIKGMPDPMSNLIAADISAETALTASGIARRALAASAEPGVYFSTLRFELSRPDDTIPGILRELTAPSLSASESEALATRAFNRIWVSHPLPQSAIDGLRTYLVEPETLLRPHLRQLLTGALLLGSLTYFDPRKAMLLAEIYQANPDTRLAMDALTSLILILASTPAHARGDRKLSEALKALESVDRLPDDLHIAFATLIRSRDTERVTRKITDELIPDLIKMKPSIDNLTKDAPGLIDEDGEMNPQWDEMLSSSGIGDKLRELSEMQSEGADVLMATMGPLKDFPFFNEVANWFLPFYTSHSIAGDDKLKAMAETIAGLPQLCDSDKYSLLLLAQRVGPAAIDGGMAQALTEQHRQEAEDIATSLPDPRRERREAAEAFVRNVYRFFRLFRRKDEFADPFASPINPVTTPLLASTVAVDENEMRLAAEFYFRRGYYADALLLLDKLEEISVPAADTYQKKGYALEQLGRPEEALAQYDTADLIDSDSVWTLRRIAALHRAAGRPAEALTFYDRIEALRPGKYADIMGRAAALEQLSRFSDALALYYRADYLKPMRPAVLRPLALCQLITGEAAKALATAERLASITGIALTPDDHLLMGHAAMATADFSRAVEAYAAAIAALQFDAEAFTRKMEARRPLLARLGADSLTINIISEAALKAAASRGSSISR